MLLYIHRYVYILALSIQKRITIHNIHTLRVVYYTVSVAVIPASVRLCVCIKQKDSSLTQQ